MLQGHASITIGEETTTFGPEDGVITIPIFTLHQYGRADDDPKGSVSRDKVLIVKEWTNPADGEKELFFRNVIGSVMDRQPGPVGNISLLMSLFTIFWYHDNYPVVWKGPRFLGKGFQAAVMRFITYTSLVVVGSLGRLLGYRNHYDEYSPAHLLSGERKKGTHPE